MLLLDWLARRKALIVSYIKGTLKEASTSPPTSNALSLLRRRSGSCEPLLKLAGLQAEWLVEWNSKRCSHHLYVLPRSHKSGLGDRALSCPNLFLPETCHTHRLWLLKSWPKYPNPISAIYSFIFLFFIKTVDPARLRCLQPADLSLTYLEHPVSNFFLISSMRAQFFSSAEILIMYIVGSFPPSLAFILVQHVLNTDIPPQVWNRFIDTLKF